MAEHSQGALDPHPTTANVRAMLELERNAAATLSWADSVSQRIARFAGTLWFVILNMAAFAVWALWNQYAPEPWRFDPYPYGLLTFIVSLEGVLVATFVLIAQNHMTRRGDRRDQLHLQIGLLTEQELTVALRLLHRVADRVGATDPADVAVVAPLGEDTDVHELARTLDREHGRGEP